MKLPRSETLRRWLWPAVALLVVVVLALTADLWWDPLRGRLGGDERESAAIGEATDAHDHDRAHDSETETLHLSEQARKNIGLKVGPVQVQSYKRTITVPALAVEQPGRTRIEMAAPMTGVVTDIAIRRGETVRSGDVLFRLRLTHEDLIDAQTEFLRTLTQLDVAQREIARLDRITREGITAGEVVLEREYERDKLQAGLGAAREALRLHGLSEEQVSAIERSRRLIREITVVAPLLHEDHSVHDDSESHGAAVGPVTMRTSAVGTQDRSSPADGESGHETHVAQLVVQEILVHRGESVLAGAPLGVLADMNRLYVEGRAFEQDAAQLAEAARQGWGVDAIVQNQIGDPDVVDGLELLHVANEIDRETRALYFYASLENEVVRDETTPDGRRYVTWRFKPGQRMQLRVPVDVWEEVIVVPVDAVAQEGPEFYVFVENGDRFDRRPVHVRYRDQYSAVIAHDGSVFPGEKVALNAAHQLQMAHKNKAAGPVDPHAGHVH